MGMPIVLRGEIVGDTNIKYKGGRTILIPYMTRENSDLEYEFDVCKVGNKLCMEAKTKAAADFVLRNYSNK